MKSWRRWLLIGALALSGLPGAAQAESDVDILLDVLVQNGTLTPVQADQVRRQIAQTKEAQNHQLAKEIVPESARNWKWNGELRLRDEIRNRVGTGNDNHRVRTRFRYGFEAKVSDDLKIGARLATGTSTDNAATAQEPTATQQSFNSFFVKFPINLDLAYLEYSPEVPGVSNVTLVGGIMENPLWTVGPMVWDSDLSWDGAVVKLSQELEPVTLFTNNGLFFLDTDETETAALWVTQAGVAVSPLADSEQEALKNLKFTGALAYHDYVNVTSAAKAGTDPIARISSNTSSVRDFNQLNPSVEIATQVAGYPVSMFTDVVHNIAAGSGSGNDGFMIGAKIGKAKSSFFSPSGLDFKHGWEAGYFFERLEENAAFDEFVDSDFGGGGTNRRGNVFWLTLATLKNSTFGTKVYAAKQLTGVRGGEDRIQLDWVTKF